MLNKQEASAAELPRSGFARERQVLRVIPIGRSTLWDRKWRERNGFPDPVRLSARVSAWDCAHIHLWLENQAKAAA